MRAHLRRYAAFWDEQEGPEALALLRITFGLALLANAVVPFATDTLLPCHADESGGGVFTSPVGTWSLFRLFPPSALGVRIVGGAIVAAAIALVVGWHTRIAAVACAALEITLHDRLNLFGMGNDGVYRVFAVLVAVAPTGAAFSVDAAIRGRGAARVPRWPRRLLLAQLTILYVETGLAKYGASWRSTEEFGALYYVLNVEGIARWPGPWVARIYPLTQAGTVVAKLFEMTFALVPLSLYCRRDPARLGPVARRFASIDVRACYMVVGACFHVALLVTTTIHLFSIAVLSIYPVMLEPQEARRVLDAIAKAWRAVACRVSVLVPARGASPPS